MADFLAKQPSRLHGRILLNVAGYRLGTYPRMNIPYVQLFEFVVGLLPHDKIWGWMEVVAGASFQQNLRGGAIAFIRECSRIMFWVLLNVPNFRDSNLFFSCVCNLDTQLNWRTW